MTIFLLEQRPAPPGKVNGTMLMIFFAAFCFQAGNNGFNIPAVIDVGDEYGIGCFHDHHVFDMIGGNQTIAAQNKAAPGIMGDNVAVNYIGIVIFG